MRPSWQTRVKTALGSLKLRLALTGALLIGASVAVTVVLVLRDTQQRAELSLLDSSLSVSTMSKTLATRVLERQIALSRAAALWPHKNRPQSVAEFPLVADYLVNQSVLQGLFFSTFLAGPDGHIAASADQDAVRKVDFNIKHRAYFTKTLAEGRAIISEPLISVRFEVVEIILTAPVRDANGLVMGVLGGVLRLAGNNFLSEMTRSSGSEHDPVSTIITDAQGRIISHPDPRWLMKNAADEPRLKEAVERWVAAGRPMEAEAWAQRTGDQFVAMAAVPEADWMTFRFASADVLLGRPGAARVEAAWLGTSVALGGALLIFFAMASMLRPLQKLERRAMGVLDDGVASDEPWPSTKGEIGELSAVFQHVIEQRAAGQRVTHELLERMQAVMVNAPIGIGFTRDRHFELVGKHYAELFGYAPEELVGQPHRLVYSSEEFYKALIHRAGEAFVAGRVHSEEIEFRRRDGSRFWGYLQGAAVSAHEPLAGTIWIVSDYTALRKQREQLSWTATHDPLTDLVNRREFESRLTEQLHERRRSEMSSALFIDLDGFKAVNDTAGHATGDAILKDVAAILSHRVRENDTVARLGGDEFAILLRGCDRQRAEQVAEQIRCKVQAHKLAWQDLSLGVTTSIGVVEIDDSLDDMAAVLAAADAACYEAKHAGRNVVRVWRGVSLIGDPDVS